jgi:hypothetical protein
LMAPGLILSSTRGVARRARLLLTGTLQTFEELLQESLPKISKNRILHLKSGVKRKSSSGCLSWYRVATCQEH